MVSPSSSPPSPRNGREQGIQARTFPMNRQQRCIDTGKTPALRSRVGFTVQAWMPVSSTGMTRWKCPIFPCADTCCRWSAAFAPAPTRILPHLWGRWREAPEGARRARRVPGLMRGREDRACGPWIGRNDVTMTWRFQLRQATLQHNRHPLHSASPLHHASHGPPPPHRGGGS